MYKYYIEFIIMKPPEKLAKRREFYCLTTEGLEVRQQGARPNVHCKEIADLFSPRG